MTNKQYSIALTVTYVPYIVAELPSNLLLKVCIISLDYTFNVGLRNGNRPGCRTQLNVTYYVDSLGHSYHVARFVHFSSSTMHNKQILLFTGVVKTYHGLLACRFFLGLFEGIVTDAR